MTHRERQLATIRHEATDRISVDAICIENGAQIAEYLGIPEDAVLDRLGIDGRIIFAGNYLGTIPVDERGEPLSAWGTSTGNDYGTAHYSPLAAADTVAAVEGYRWWPDAAKIDYHAAAEAARDCARQYATRGPYWLPLFCQVCELMGMEEAMMKMLSEPAVFEAALERVFQYTLDYCTRLLDVCGDALDIFYLGDDFATQRGLMIPPASWRQFLKPRYAQLFSLAKARGKFVWFHSCGDITSILPDLIDIGVDVWETVQLHALPMTPAELKRAYGQQMTFFGAISTQRLPFATPEDIRAEVRQTIAALGKNGGYICGPDHHIKPDVPAVNAVTLFDSAMGW